MNYQFRTLRALYNYRKITISPIELLDIINQLVLLKNDNSIQRCYCVLRRIFEEIVIRAYYHNKNITISLQISNFYIEQKRISLKLTVFCQNIVQVFIKRQFVKKKNILRPIIRVINASMRCRFSMSLVLHFIFFLKFFMYTVKLNKKNLPQLLPIS